MSNDFPLDLIDVVFVKTVVESIPGHNRSGDLPPDGISNTVKATIGENAGESELVMRTLVNAERSTEHPYYIDFEVFVRFRIRPDAPDADVRKATSITGHSIAYGAIREAVVWLTGRHIYGPLLLPISTLAPSQRADERASSQAATAKH